MCNTSNIGVLAFILALLVGVANLYQYAALDDRIDSIEVEKQLELAYVDGHRAGHALATAEQLPVFGTDSWYAMVDPDGNGDPIPVR